MESSRQSRYVILAAFFGFFALSTPIMLKLLPGIMKTQMPDFPPELMQFDTAQCMQNYIKNIYQLGNIVMALTLMGILAEERTGGKLVFPISQGAGAAEIVGAKLAHYIAAVAGIVFAASMVNYYYSTMFFPDNGSLMGAAVQCASLLALYFATRVVLVTFASALFARPMAAGLATILISFLEAIAVSFPRLKPLAAYNLVVLATEAASGQAPEMPWAMVTSLAIQASLLVLATILRMRRLDILPGLERV